MDNITYMWMNGWMDGSDYMYVDIVWIYRHVCLGNYTGMWIYGWKYMLACAWMDGWMDLITCMWIYLWICVHVFGCMY
jgi:hypothetical protein